MTAAKPRRHRWVRTGFGAWRCTRRGCGLHRKATDKSSDGYAYQRLPLTGLRDKRTWYTIQQMGGAPVCVWPKP